MKKHLITLMAMLSLSSAYAVEPNIKQGNVKTGLDIELTHQKPENQDGFTYFNTSAQAEFFLFDKFALGGKVGYFTSSRAADFILGGPSATWFLFQQDAIALSIGGAFLFSHNWDNPTDYNTYWVQGSAGLDFFLTDSVSLGPKFQYTRQMRDKNLSDTDFYSMIAGFNVYL